MTIHRRIGLYHEGSPARRRIAAFAGVTALLLALYLACSFGLSHGVVLLNATNGYSALYDMDIRRTVYDLTNDRRAVSREPQRTHAHPLYKLALAPIVSSLRFLPGLRNNPADPVRILTACVMAINGLLAGLLTMQLARGALLPGVLAVVLTGVSFSSVLLASIPDAGSFSGPSTLLPLLYLNRRIDRPFNRSEARVWGLLGVVCMAFTITQIINWLIALGARLWLRRGGARGTESTTSVAPGLVLCAAVFVVAALSAFAVQKTIYPRVSYKFVTDPFGTRVQRLGFESKFLRLDDFRNEPCRHVARLALHFFGYNFAAPLPSYSDYMRRKWKRRYWSLSLEEVRPAQWGRVDIALAVLLGGLFLASTASLARADARFLAPALVVACQFLLHLVYGREYIIYSANWHGALVAILIAGVWTAFGPARCITVVFLTVLSLILVANNIAVLRRTYTEARIGLQLSRRDAEGKPRPKHWRQGVAR